MAARAQSIRPRAWPSNGDGVRTVSCTAWNNAVDPQGNHNSGTSSVTVHIDEAPPSVSLEPENPDDPTGRRRGYERHRVRCRRRDRSRWPRREAGAGRASLRRFSGSQLAGALQRRRGERSVHVQGHEPATTSATAPQPLGPWCCRSRTQAISEVSVEQTPGTRCAGPDAKHDGVKSSARSRHHQESDVGQAGESGLRIASDGAVLRPRAPLVPAPAHRRSDIHRQLRRTRRAVAVSPPRTSNG